VRVEARELTKTGYGKNGTRTTGVFVGEDEPEQNNH
jgi:hypothetical protein